MPFDLYVWEAPRDVDDARAAALVRDWEEAGADPTTAPFEPGTNLGWFHRELRSDNPGVATVSDANPNPSTRPVWLSTDDEPPARIVAVRLTHDTAAHVEGDVFGLAMKYDLVVFDARSGHVHFPMQEMSDYADATFWPSGAIQAGVAGAFGLLIAGAAWIIGIPILSWIVIIVGGFMFVMAVFTFVHEGRKALRSKGSDTNAPPG